MRHGVRGRPDWRLVGMAAVWRRHDRTLTRRVQVARLPIMYAQIMLDPKSPKRPALISRFEKIARSEGVTHTGEGQALDDWLKVVRQ